MRILYTIWQWTWGIVQNLAGFVLFLRHLDSPRYNYKGAVVTVWHSKSSMTLGMFVFLTDDPACFYSDMRSRCSDEEIGKMILVHEYGHTIQSLIFGPLYIFVVGIPSVLWSFLPGCAKKRAREGLSYFDFFCERNANALGEAVTGEKSMGRAKSDM